MKNITLELLMSTAKELVDDGSNTEYLRGVCELIADVSGNEGKEHYIRSMEIARLMQVSEVNVLKMYNPLI